MHKIIALTLGAGVFLGTLVISVRATNPVPPTQVAARDSGRVLVLANERTLTGDIERAGDQYRIKRLTGVTTIPADKVLKLCASLEEAYQYLRSRANLNDVDERLRLGEWCRQHNLRERAVQEMEAALQLRPGDARVRRLLAHVKEVQQRSQAPKTPQVIEETFPQIDVSSESLGLFATKVQPVLMNACVNCHTGGRGGAFQLTRVTGPGMANRRSTEKNLSATLAQISGKDPMSSRLLHKAVSIHGSGMTQAPMKSRQAAPFRLLEQWVSRTVETTPTLRDDAHASVTTTPNATPRNEGGWGQDRETPAAPKALPPVTPPVPPMPTATPPKEVTPVRAAVPKGAGNDPVDPDAFNREYHPGRGTPEVPGNP